MTTREYVSTDAMGRPRNESPAREGFEWNCPCCGKSELNTSNGESGRQNATSSLRTHILASDGNEHGPKGEYPTEEGLPPFDEYVVEVHRSR